MVRGWRLVLSAVVAPLSCAQVLSLDRYDTSASGPVSMASSSGGSTGMGGEASGGGGGGGLDCLAELPGACGVASPAPGGLCPPRCTCARENVCEVLCELGSGDCVGDTIVCPEGFACDVVCTADGCTNTTIVCPSDHECHVRCDSPEACRGTEVKCSNGPCLVSCTDSAYACYELTLTCGCNRCSAFCEFLEPGLLPAVACGHSCDCDPCTVQ